MSEEDEGEDPDKEEKAEDEEEKEEGDETDDEDDNLVDNIEQCVLDFVDAFWQVPLSRSERRFFCGRLRGRYLCYHRTPQGSRLGPFSWAVLSSLATRLGQSLFVRPGCSRAGKRRFSLRLQTYVDDPIAVLRGTEGVCMEQAAILMLAWAAVGIDLAVKKGQYGTTIDWIGATFTVLPNAVEATIHQHRLDELAGLLG